MTGGSRSTARFDADLVVGGRPLRGRVAVVFPHAALVECTDGELLTLIHPSRELVPLGVVVPWDAVPAGGQEVRLDERVLRLAGQAVVLEGEGVALRLPAAGWPPSRVRLASQLKGLSLPPRTRAILGGNAAGAATSDDAGDLAALHAGLVRLVAALREGYGVEAAARGLVGLGPGATPSGDDVLVGAAAAGSRLRGWYPEDAVPALLAVLRLVPPSGTTPVGRSMLGHAARGVFPEALCRLAGALGRADADLTPEVLLLADVGEHSGADMLAGAMAVAVAAVTRDA